MPKDQPIALCDRDHSAMISVQLNYPDIALETPGFRCTVPGCSRYYTSGRGYFNVVDNRPLGEKVQQRCPKCGAAMYLKLVPSNANTWRCPTLQCGHEQGLAE